MCIRPKIWLNHHARPFAAALVIAITAITPSHAQGPDESGEAASVIEAVPLSGEDQRIKQRLDSVFGEVDALSGIEVDVNEGVVRLSGKVANKAQANRALSLANRLEGVVTVEDELERTLTIEDNLDPILEQLYADVRLWVRAAPLYLLALLVFTLITVAGHVLAGRKALWNRVMPNPFLAELVGQFVRGMSIFVGMIIALNLIGATALIGTIIGGLGLLGLAIGFAVRDTIENYVASIMLSLRQPFRAQDHVIIGDHEGIVIRLTPRATILMTLNGNHLRIPNSFVFKAAILNYTRNPERRFEFFLGVDADDDPGAAMAVGINIMKDLAWVLDDPAPIAIIESVGDSNIVLKFMGWLDQRDTDFGKGRSLAIRAVKNGLEAGGFTLPEPIYRLRFDNSPERDVATASSRPGAHVEKSAQAGEIPRSAQDTILDLQPDLHVQHEAGREQSLQREEDLLDSSRPIE